MTTQHRCPKCQSRYAYFHFGYNTWRCPTCGTFVPYPAEAPNDSPSYCKVCRTLSVDQRSDGKLQCRLCRSFPKSQQERL